MSFKFFFLFIVITYASFYIRVKNIEIYFHNMISKKNYEN